MISGWLTHPTTPHHDSSYHADDISSRSPREECLEQLLLMSSLSHHIIGSRHPYLLSPCRVITSKSMVFHRVFRKGLPKDCGLVYLHRPEWQPTIPRALFRALYVTKRWERKREKEKKNHPTHPLDRRCDRPEIICRMRKLLSLLPSSTPRTSSRNEQTCAFSLSTLRCK